jgi:hypothetical protein
MEAVEALGLEDALASLLEGLQGAQRASQFFIGSGH